MKILHTADWHLGAYLGNYSRVDEQAAFLQQLLQIVDENRVDMVIVAGDVYDTGNPPAAAEALFYSTLAQLNDMGVPAVIVAGNHDSAERLSAISPMAGELGIHIFSEPNCIEIDVHGQSCVIAAMPFVSEKRLNETIFTSGIERDMQKEYSAKISELFAKMSEKFKPDGVSIAIGHFHIAGGESSRGLERDIQIGGVFAVQPQDLPAADYIAMGHLHRAQRIKYGLDKAYLAHYSGSPLPYSLSERGQAKSVNIAQIVPGQSTTVEKVYLDCPKPIEIWAMPTAADVIKRCETPNNAYKYIVITDETTISAYDIKEMHRLTAGIVSIELAADKQGAAQISAQNLQTLEPREEFANFYEKTKGTAPSKEIASLFDEILSHEEIL